MTTTPDPPIAAPKPGRWSRIWRVARIPIGLAAAGAAIWAVTGKTDELSGATTYLAHLRWPWVAVALGAEICSYLAYASLQRGLLSAGRVNVPIAPMTGATVAGSAIQNSLPGGIVFFAAYMFRQYRRFGADDVLAGWTFAATGVLSVLALGVIAAVGLALALSAGSAYDLVEVIVGILLVSVLVVLAWAERARLLPHAARAVRLSQRLVHRPHPDQEPAWIIGRWLDQIGAISPSRGDWVRAATMSFGNWIADLGCLTVAFFAVGAGVPWRGLLLAYGAGQLAATLPISPGGLGVVEGSLTVALVTFGGGEASTVAAVLLYRLISFWLLLPVGWGTWGALTWMARNRKPVAVPAVEVKAA